MWVELDLLPAWLALAGRTYPVCQPGFRPGPARMAAE